MQQNITCRLGRVRLPASRAGGAHTGGRDTLRGTGTGAPGRPTSLHEEFGVKGAGGVDALQDVDHVAGTDAERVQAGDDLRQR